MLDVINGIRYCLLMIRSFKSGDAEALFRLETTRRFAPIARPALRKLVQLDLAANLDDLRVPPGNRLEALKGDRKGQWSIRINDQFRICFRWTADGPEDVEIVDYH
jgi:proteic killer suppression protein